MEEVLHFAQERSTARRSGALAATGNPNKMIGKWMDGGGAALREVGMTQQVPRGTKRRFVGSFLIFADNPDEKWRGVRLCNLS